MSIPHLHRHRKSPRRNRFSGTTRPSRTRFIDAEFSRRTFVKTAGILGAAAVPRPAATRHRTRRSRRSRNHSMQHTASITLQGQRCSVACLNPRHPAPPSSTRFAENPALTGSKKGCDHRDSAEPCTVLVDGRRVNSCLTLALTRRRSRDNHQSKASQRETHASPSPGCLPRARRLPGGSYCTPRPDLFRTVRRFKSTNTIATSALYPSRPATQPNRSSLTTRFASTHERQYLSLRSLPQHRRRRPRRIERSHGMESLQLPAPDRS